MTNGPLLIARPSSPSNDKRLLGSNHFRLISGMVPYFQKVPPPPVLALFECGSLFPRCNCNQFFPPSSAAAPRGWSASSCTATPPSSTRARRLSLSAWTSRPWPTTETEYPSCIKAFADGGSSRGVVIVRVPTCEGRQQAPQTRRRSHRRGGHVRARGNSDGHGRGPGATTSARSLSSFMDGRIDACTFLFSCLLLSSKPERL
jgi:hypothetical protein